MFNTDSVKTQELPYGLRSRPEPRSSYLASQGYLPTIKIREGLHAIL